MRFGTLDFTPTVDSPELLAEATAHSISDNKLADVWVAGIDPAVSDTAAFCERYRIGLEASANCVIVEARRAEKTWYAACVVLAVDRIDINGTVRRWLDARKISFAPMDIATSLTHMEYGGITPVGLPSEWPLFVDRAVAESQRVIIGSGIRKSKLLIGGHMLTSLPQASVVDLAKRN